MCLICDQFLVSEMENIGIELVDALVRLSVDTPGRIAEASDMDRPSLLAALAGKRALSKRKIPQLLRVLGIPSGHLDSSVVHVWNVGVDITPLCVAIRALFPVGAVLAVLLEPGPGVFDVNRAYEEALYAIYDERTQVLVRRQGLGLELPSAPAINPDTVPNLTWRSGKFGEGAFVTLSRECYCTWRKEKAISVREYQDLLQKTVPVDWGAVVSFAESEGLTAEKMLRFVQAILSATRN